MKNINISVMFVDSIPSRIYMALLNKNGYKVNNIIYLDKEPNSKKHSTITNLRNEPLDDLAKMILNLHGLKTEDLNNCLDHYKDNELKKVKIKNIHDESLIKHITENSYKTILFTGGGILKENILNIPNVKFIHIHPGIVPDIRGADCLYWSFLLRGKGGYSAFYMNAGIDTGDILIKREFDINFKSIKLSKYNNDELYTAILTYYDPCLRIKTFIDLLQALDSRQQTADSRQQTADSRQQTA